LILHRYIVREIIKPKAATGTVVILIFAGYSAARFLADAVNGLLPGTTVAALIFLRIVIALEVLLPVTLYLSVIVALGRLYADQEMTALEAVGVSPGRIIKAVFSLSLVFAVFVSGLSLYARPWAYEQYYRLKAEAKENFDLRLTEAGRFYEIDTKGRVFFARKVDQKQGRAEDVFIQRVLNGEREITRAREATQGVDPQTGEKVLVFKNGFHYRIGLDRGRDTKIQFQRTLLSLRQKEVIPLEYRRKAASTLSLARSDHPEDIAEFHWRLSTGLSTLLLGLIGVPLSRTAPRRGKYAKVGLAVLIFAVYYNLGAVAKSWVEQGTIPPLPGIWWVVALLAGLAIALNASPFSWRLRVQKGSPGPAGPPRG